MSEKKYEVLDGLDHVIASNMDLSTALLLIEAFCEKYFNERANLRLWEMDKDERK